jgi:hypothetical protein
VPRPEEQTGASKRSFAEDLDESSNQPALQDDANDPDKSKQVTGLARVEAEMLFGKEAKRVVMMAKPVIVKK